MSSGSDVPGSGVVDFATATHQPHTLTSNQLKSRLYGTPEVLNNSRPQFKVLHRRSTTSEEVQLHSDHPHSLHALPYISLLNHALVI